MLNGNNKVTSKLPLIPGITPTTNQTNVPTEIKKSFLTAIDH